jgi:hypothetical protein
MSSNRILGKVVNLGQSAANLISKEAQRPHVRMNNKLSVHRPKHQFISKKQFGYYLAGVIDGDGSISKDSNKITITFHKEDISFALKLRSYIGYGKVSTRNSVSITYVITHTIGLIQISNLIYGKLMFKSKISNLNLLIERLSQKLNSSSTILLPMNICTKLFKTWDSSKNLFKCTEVNQLFKTGYLAGLIDTDGSLRVRVLNRKRKSVKEVRLGLRIELKDKDRYVLDLIYKEIGGNLYERYHTKSNTRSLCYDTVSFDRIHIILNYLDKFHLQSKEYLRYTIVRKAYLLIQDKKHLTPYGMEKIEKYLKTITNISKDK